MPKSLQQLTIFVSGPSGTESEKAALRVVAQEINRRVEKTDSRNVVHYAGGRETTRSNGRRLTTGFGLTAFSDCCHLNVSKQQSALPADRSGYSLQHVGVLLHEFQHSCANSSRLPPHD